MPKVGHRAAGQWGSATPRMGGVPPMWHGQVRDDMGTLLLGGARFGLYTGHERVDGLEVDTQDVWGCG